MEQYFNRDRKTVYQVGFCLLPVVTSVISRELSDYGFVVSDSFVVVCAKERVIKSKFTRSIHSSVWFHLKIDLVTSELTCLSQTLRFYTELTVCVTLL